LKIRIQHKIYTIPKQSYMLYIDNECILFLQSHDKDYYLLGNVFLNNYYMIYDMEK